MQKIHLVFQQPDSASLTRGSHSEISDLVGSLSYLDLDKIWGGLGF